MEAFPGVVEAFGGHFGLQIWRSLRGSDYRYAEWGEKSMKLSRGEAKKMRRALRVRGLEPGVQRRFRPLMAPTRAGLVRVCWECLGTGWKFLGLGPLRFAVCGECGGVGGDAVSR